jgi:mannose-6-phosphate isomerase
MKYKSMEERPWGRFFVIEDQKNFKIKKIEVEIGQRLSYQYHKKRSEVWVIITGTGIVTINDKKQDFKKDDVIIIPKESKHRIENNGNDVVVFIEIQTGSYFGEDDIVRIKDDYNRLK